MFKSLILAWRSAICASGDPVSLSCSLCCDSNVCLVSLVIISVSSNIPFSRNSLKIKQKNGIFIPILEKFRSYTKTLR